MAKKLIIAAHSARGFAQVAAACGYEVIALDAFADADTQAFSTLTFKLKFNYFALDTADFMRQFVEMESSVNLNEIEGFLYGSLFDDGPELLAWVAERVRVLGNTPEVMQIAKSFEFFELLDELKITHPEVYLSEKTSHSSFPHTTLQVPERLANRSALVVRKRKSIFFESVFNFKMDSRFRGNDKVNHTEGMREGALAYEVGGNWLSKRLGGTGGTHIKPATDNSSGDYFQRKINGKPISMLFVADGKTAQLIGFNEQFIAPTNKMPYRFAGAVGGLILPENIQQQFEHAAQQLTIALGLRGINSLDAIFAKDNLTGETLCILELNPRLSATFHLYPNLLTAHLQGCAGELIDIELPANTSNTQLILYADNPVHIAADFAWPNWVADIPAVIDGDSSVIIQKDAPICTVQATANDAETASTLVLQRAKNLRELLND